MIDCFKHPGQPLFACRPCYDASFRQEWRIASGAPGKRTWWVLRDTTWEERAQGRAFHIGAEGPRGKIRTFSTPEAAQKAADKLNYPSKPPSHEASNDLPPSIRSGHRCG